MQDTALTAFDKGRAMRDLPVGLRRMLGQVDGAGCPAAPRSATCTLTTSSTGAKTAGPTSPTSSTSNTPPTSRADGFWHTARVTDFRTWRAATYFPALDGLRAMSVLLVMMAHSPGRLFQPFHGRLGVTIFFVISGLLITTLLLRERDEHGSVSLRAFYVRRACRIFPLYYTALITFSAAVGVGLARHSGDYLRRVLHFLTFTNEWASPGTFGHSWSLGVEEKFYLVWPVLAFLLPASKRQPALFASGLWLASTTLGLFQPDSPLSFYSPILGGCLLALALHNPHGFRRVSALANPLWSVALCALAVALLVTSKDQGRVNVVFGAAVTACFPAVLLGPAWFHAVLRNKPLVFVGRRAYAIYLFHPLVGSLVAKGITHDAGIWPAAYLLTTLVLTLACADVLYRILERPMIRLGHRLTQDRLGEQVAVPSWRASPTA